MIRHGSIRRTAGQQNRAPRTRAFLAGSAFAGLALCASPLVAQGPSLHPKLGVDPLVEQIVRASFPGRALEKASLHDFDVVAQQTRLYAQVERVDAIQDFRVMQDLAVRSHLGTRTRNDWFSLPVPAHPARTIYGSFGMPMETEAQLLEAEPNDRPWRANGMTCTDTMDGQITADDDDWFTLIVPQVQAYDIAVNSGGNTDTRLTIYDGSLSRVAFNDDAGTVDPQIRITLAPGTYYLVVDGHDPANTTGTYRIAMSCNAESTITSAAPVNGTFAGQPADTYRFNLAVDCVVSFRCDAAPGSMVNPALTVTGPNGFDALLSNEDAITPPSAFVQLHLPAGFHFLHVRDSGGNGGAYVLTMSEVGRPIPNATLGVSVPLSRENPLQARMVRFNNPSFAEILSRTVRSHALDVSAEHVWCDVNLSTTEGSAKNLTGVNVTDAEQLMGLPSGTFYLLLRPVASRLSYSTRNYARRLSSTANHPGPFIGTRTGAAGFATTYVTPTSTIRLRQRVNADYMTLAGNFSWWFDTALLRVNNSVAQTSVTVNAALMYPESGPSQSFANVGANPTSSGVLDTADGIAAACYWLNNGSQLYDLATSAVFEFPVVGALSGADAIEFETISFLSGNDASQPGATVPSTNILAPFTALTEGRWEIWNPTTNAWEQLTGAFTAVNGGTTWIHSTNLPFSESQGDFDATVTANSRPVTALRQLGADYLNIAQPTIGQQHLFSYTNQARAMMKVRTSLGALGFVDPEAYIYDQSGRLLTWQDDRINGTLRDPDFWIALDKGTQSIVVRSWDSCCTGDFSFVPRSRDFNVYGNVARGQQVTFEISSQPNALYAIYAAAGLLPFQFPLDGSGIVGDLVLDVGTLSLVLNGLVPGTGVFAQPITIPNDPALANRTVYAQAVTIETFAGPMGIVSQEQRLRIQ
ncbi:MAG: PPC domain-containing protein [Planctomycetes bacterium]|nr:PPC domain-containing protein [Planctomycetota bacterium]